MYRAAVAQQVLPTPEDDTCSATARDRVSCPVAVDMGDHVGADRVQSRVLQRSPRHAIQVACQPLELHHVARSRPRHGLGQAFDGLRNVHPVLGQ
eukprot:3008504-Pyramimonas_sp.AAC.1